jgi:hypothetical protein
MDDGNKTFFKLTRRSWMQIQLENQWTFAKAPIWMERCVILSNIQNQLEKSALVM